MNRKIRTVCAILLVAVAAPAAEPLPPTRVTIDSQPRSLAKTMELLGQQSGMPIELLNIDPDRIVTPLRFENAPFWDVLATLAAAADARIACSADGQRIVLRPGEAKTAASIDGPFRVQAASIQATLDPTTGQSRYDCMLQVMWEPRLAVVRLDAQPTLTQATDDRGTPLAAADTRTLVPIADRCSHTLTVRLSGLSRESKSIAVLEGRLRVTAAARMLDFTFDPIPEKLPVALHNGGVEVRLDRLDRSARGMQAEIAITMPEGHPPFESFESWTGRNRLTLISPDRSTRLDAELIGSRESGRHATLQYRFTEPPRNLAGWLLSARTPAPLHDAEIRFRLADIDLP